VFSTSVKCCNDKQLVEAIWHKAANGHPSPQSDTCFLVPTPVQIPNGISIGSAVFARLTTVIDRQTDRRRYSVCKHWAGGRIYVVLWCGLKLTNTKLSQQTQIVWCSQSLFMFKTALAMFDAKKGNHCYAEPWHYRYKNLTFFICHVFILPTFYF